ncbi:hypothetical protein J6590_050209 [Homalodisca vitripennis]|nr:hypothetical protein J6590_050209 [Homalodisca vitripennis]
MKIRSGQPSGCLAATRAVARRLAWRDTPVSGYGTGRAALPNRARRTCPHCIRRGGGDGASLETDLFVVSAIQGDQL